MNTEEFVKLLYNTKIPSTLTGGTDERPDDSKLLKYTRGSIPSKLYRFRQCKERHFDDFYNDKFGIATGIHMNDGFDTRLFFDRVAAEKWIETLLNTLTDSKVVC